MRLLLLLVFLLRVVEPNEQVLGFLGDNVTLLPESGQALLNTTSIKWLILANDTWIATHQHGQTKTDHFWQYRGRLTLDSQTGALTINNLIRRDAMQYVMEVGFQGGQEISHKLDLRVETRLEPPNVTTLFAAWDNGSCTTALRCRSPDPQANLTWSAQPAATHRTLASWCASHSAFLLVALGSDRQVRFTCNTNNALESVAGSLVVECGGGEPIRESAESSLFGHGLALGSCLGVVLAVLVYILRGKIEGALRRLTGKESPSNTSAVTARRAPEV